MRPGHALDSSQSRDRRPDVGPASLGPGRARPPRPWRNRAARSLAAGYSSAAVTMGHLALKRAIRHAEADDLVGRNVAALVDTPTGQQGRPSKSLTLGQAVAVITAARTLPVMELHPGLKDVRRPAALMYAYIVLSLLSGVRTEEARALCWQHVDLDGDLAASPPVPPHVAVWRSVRVTAKPRPSGHVAPSAFPRWRWRRSRTPGQPG